MFTVSCDSSDEGAQGDATAAPSTDGGAAEVIPPRPVAVGAYTYALSEATASLPLWTTPTANKITTGARAPEGDPISGLSLSAAGGEVEPIQWVMGPAEGAVTVELMPFEGFDAPLRVELTRGGYVEGWLETLTPIEFGDEVPLSADHGVPIWLTIYVPRGAAAGEHRGAIKLTHGDEIITIPLRLYVFDFEIPSAIHFASQINISIAGLMEGGRSEEAAKDLLFEHRLTPKSVTWPSGFSWGITWDSDRNPDRCEAFTDEPDEGAAYAIGQLAPKYILGEGWNGVGFPNAMLFQFVDNSTPRPERFCEVERGDHRGADAYNRAWSAWLGQLNGYLVEHGLAERAYYYVQNEPQSAEDEALAAHLCRLTKAAAPDLRIAVSEEPKPSIAEDPGGACGYDIWIAHVRAYEEGYAWRRQREHGEQIWLYSLDHDPDPYFNPTRVDGLGLHARIIPWASWSHRARGWAYYDAGRFFHEAQPGVRAELLREGFEDYEYLWLANGGAHPRVDETSAMDATVRSVAAGMTSWTKSPDALMSLRHELGLFIEGSREAPPRLEIEVDRPLSAYYINFQDPEGEPTAEPLIINGHQYLKIGWTPYDEALGYGWSGEHMGTNILMEGYREEAGFNEAERSYIYDDYGRDNLFEFTLAPGTYEVTVGVGMAGRAYEGQPHQVSIEGVTVVDDEPTTPGETVLRRSITLEITDGSLSMLAGGRSPSIDDWSYTFMAYLEIVPVE
ncbi:hypothetical protein KKF91_04465 [Myxococcota bacterium]|nr:hypothetical protein [Myxococcota bacterium]